jgi:UDP-N-acetylglucosamine:LPS N-acetylglucosamine transferase
LFVGEPEDVPDISFGFGLPNRREFAKATYTFTGYIFPFDVDAYKNKEEVKSKLGYGTEPLVICSIGGTSIGKEMLELCGEAYTIVKKSIPELHMVIVTGPRLSPESLKLPAGIEVKGFVPRLYEHFAASDLAIVQGGATSTLELTALRIPFIYFPIEGHCEQANVARMLDQHGAGIRLNLSKTTSELLAGKMIGLIGTKVTYPEINTSGAQIAANKIVELLNRK